MNKRDLLAVGLKLVGIVTLVNAAISIPSTVSSSYWVLHEAQGSLKISNPSLHILMAVLAVVASLAIGAWLAFRSDAIANGLEKDTTPVSLDRTFWSAPAFAIAIRVVGMVLLAYAIPHLISTFAERYLEWKSAGEGSLAEAFSASFWSKHWAALIQRLLTTLIGAALLFGAAGITRLVFREAREGNGGTG